MGGIRPRGCDRMMRCVAGRWSCFPVTVTLFWFGACAGEQTPVTPDPGPEAVPGSCTVQVAPDTLLFGWFWEGNMTPRSERVVVNVSCTGQAASSQASIAPRIAGEIATWEESQCHNVAARRLCGDVTPLEYGFADFIVTYGSVADTVPIIVNRLPRKLQRMDLEIDPGQSVTLDLSSYFEDPDGDALTYSVQNWASELVDITISGSEFTLLGVAEGYFHGSGFTITVADRFHPVDHGSGHVQIGCPRIDELRREGTGRIIVAAGEQPVRASECDRNIIDAAVAYWEQVLANDNRTIHVTMSDAGPDMATSGLAGGSGPEAGNGNPETAPWGILSIGSEVGLITSPAQFYNTVRQQLAQALGFGTGAGWRARLVHPFQQPADHDNPPDTHFAGESAYQAFLDLGGGDFYGTEGVPVSNGSPGPVSPNSFWRFNIIDQELMAGCWDLEGDPCPDVLPVSTITLAAMADMGWTVDMSLAEPGVRVGNCTPCERGSQYR